MIGIARDRRRIWLLFRKECENSTIPIRYIDVRAFVAHRFCGRLVAEQHANMESLVPSITREHRGIVIDGYALVLFQDEVVLGADVQRSVDIPIRGAFLRSIHCKIAWSALSGYAIEKADAKAEIKVNGRQITRVGLHDGDTITLGRAMSPQATLRFRLPGNCGSSAVLELPVSGAALDLLHIPLLSSSRIRHVLLLREYGTIGHDPMAHVYVPDFPCCNIRLRWLEGELIALAERGVLGNSDSEHDKVFLSAPSSLEISRLSCQHQLKNLSSRFREHCDLQFADLHPIRTHRREQ